MQFSFEKSLPRSTFSFLWLKAARAAPAKSQHGGRRPEGRRKGLKRHARRGARRVGGRFKRTRRLEPPCSVYYTAFTTLCTTVLKKITHFRPKCPRCEQRAEQAQGAGSGEGEEQTDAAESNWKGRRGTPSPQGAGQRGREHQPQAQAQEEVWAREQGGEDSRDKGAGQPASRTAAQPSEAEEPASQGAGNPAGEGQKERRACTCSSTRKSRRAARDTVR